MNDITESSTPVDTVPNPDTVAAGAPEGTAHAAASGTAANADSAGTTSTASGARRRAGDARRREICQAVREISSEEGVSHLTVSAVTKRAGCTRSLFYHYFSDMDEAVAAVMDEAIDKIIAELEHWNASRVVGDIEGALDSVAPLFKRLVADGHELPGALTAGSGALYGGFLHSAVERVARYICDTTVADFMRHHELRIDHVYETFYTLVMGLLMYIRTHPDVPDETVKDIIASTLHIEGYTAKYPERRPST